MRRVGTRPLVLWSSLLPPLSPRSSVSPDGERFMTGKVVGGFRSGPGKQTTRRRPTPSRGTGRRPWWPPPSPPRAAAPSCTHTTQGGNSLRSHGSLWNSKVQLRGARLNCSFRLIVCVCVCVCVIYLGPKHMQRLARYPLEKEKKIMKMMYQASWPNSTGR